MRLSRIIMALTAGLAVAAVPTVAGAAQPQPSPSASQPQPSLSPSQPQPSVTVYPPGRGLASLTVTLPTITLGHTFTLHGSGFAPDETVEIDVSISALPGAAPAAGTARRGDGSTVAMAAVAYARPLDAQPEPAPLQFEVTADATGAFTVPYRPTEVGRYTFSATGESSGLTASATGTVLSPRAASPSPSSGGGLPVTGSSLSTPLKIGVGLAGVGALLVLLSLAWRRRGGFGMGPR
ncbi:hypothetical protein AB0C02_14280 [Micromonospora sp. NPDC048999]|uniref:hypothetical protein n=1 Tax=Micromonospora sp. NPDC048999 TaxID=3155391 RepID=UPI0033ECD2F4